MKKRDVVKEKHPLIAYPKLSLFMLGVVCAYVFFKVPHPEALTQYIQSTGYIGIFIVGLFYSLGFLAPFAVGVFLSITYQNVLLASIIGALGSLVTDMILFLFSQHSLRKEIHQIEHSHPLAKFHKFIKRNVSNHFQRVSLFIIAAVFIASPLPDEIGVTMLAGINALHKKTFMILSFLLHVLGLYALIYIGQ